MAMYASELTYAQKPARRLANFTNQYSVSHTPNCDEDFEIDMQMGILALKIARFILGIWSPEN